MLITFDGVEPKSQPSLWLQRSQMFIETVMSMTRAPAERNVSDNCLHVHFAPLERGGPLYARVL